MGVRQAAPRARAVHRCWESGPSDERAAGGSELAPGSHTSLRSNQANRIGRQRRGKLRAIRKDAAFGRNPIPKECLQVTSIYRRTYRLNVGLRLFLLAGGLGFLIVPVMLAVNWKKEQSGPLEAFFGAVLVLFGAFCIGEALVSRRVTSPAAIEQIDFLYRLAVPWSEIGRIEVNPYGIVNLMLKHPAASGCLPIVWYCRLFGFDRMISVSGFGTGREHSEFVADIARFAPHLRNRKKTNGIDIFQQLQWYVVRVLLQGPTKSDNAQALEEVREELLSRSYLENPEVIWGDDADGLVIRVQVELGRAGAHAAAAFVGDEVLKAACAVLPIDVEGSVKMLGSEAVQGGQQAKA